MKNLLRLIFVALILVLLNASAIAQLSVAPPPNTVTISSGVMAGMLLEKTNPVYPPIAKAARVSGTVVLQATISKTGTIENLRVISGPAMLQQAALEAVKAWRYRPYLLMGEPVEVETTINVIFTLGGSPTQSSPAAGSQEAAPPLAQTTAVPPPPMPAPDGPSLEVTMQFIQTRLNEQGKSAFVEYRQNTSNGATFAVTIINEISNVVADQTQCRISYHRKATQDGNVYKNEDNAFSLREVQDILVRPFEQHETEYFASTGANIVVTSTTPPVTVLTVRRLRGEVNFFDLTDADLADRIAKAMVHAVELCGGGNKEPF
jgi:TonB family protein